jgi:small subunit ribosomal protein S19
MVLDKKKIIGKKEFSYRGQSLDELKKLDIREFAKLLKSNEKRTALRQYDELHKFLIVCNNKLAKNKQIRTHLRHLVVVPNMVGMRINVYNGKQFLPVDINGEMLGHRLGEFSPTRTKVKHGSAGVGATRSSASRSVK